MKTLKMKRCGTNLIVDCPKENGGVEPGISCSGCLSRSVIHLKLKTVDCEFPGQARIKKETYFEKCKYPGISVSY